MKSDAKPRKIRIGRCVANTAVILEKAEDSSLNLVGKAVKWVCPVSTSKNVLSVKRTRKFFFLNDRIWFKLLVILCFLMFCLLIILHSLPVISGLVWCSPHSVPILNECLISAHPSYSRSLNIWSVYSSSLFLPSQSSLSLAWQQSWMM